MLSSGRDDSFIKLPKALPVLFAARIVNLRVFVLFLSKNENNNGFELIGLNSFLFECRRAVYFPFFRCTLHCFPWLFALDWMIYLRIEHHLAAKFGTFSAFLT